MITQKLIGEQLQEQSIAFAAVSAGELAEVVKHWRTKFIGTKTAPALHMYKWHIFSFRQTTCLEGEPAEDTYHSQYAADVYIFNEKQQFAIRCFQAKPEIVFRGFVDDIYICHHAMKWTFVITHENPDIGPFFSK